MSTEVRMNAFCDCGGILVPKIYDNRKLFYCYSCGSEKEIPKDTSEFQIQYFGSSHRKK